MEDLKLEDELTGAPVPLASGVGPLPLTLLARELGFSSGVLPKSGGRQIFEKAGGNQIFGGSEDKVAEERLISRAEFAVTNCQLAAPTNAQPSRRPRDGAGVDQPHVPPAGFINNAATQQHSTRSTFLMVFSPDRLLIASTHGDHHVYVSQASSGKCERVLRGHPRTPWCVAFHPSRKNLLASGCLGGHVRVWDLLGGGSEVWRTEGVIASLAFHPFDSVLAVAAFDELLFWDWSKSSEPFAVAKTAHEEKVRYVKFDSLGHTLITGVANTGPRPVVVSFSAMEGPQQRTHCPRYVNWRTGETMGPAAVAAFEERRSRLLGRYERIIQQFRNFNPENDPDVGDEFRPRNPSPPLVPPLGHHHDQQEESSPSPFRGRGPSSLTRDTTGLESRNTSRIEMGASANNLAFHPETAVSSATTSTEMPPARFPSSILRFMDTPHGDRLTSVSVQNSASQTLSDLAQAATNQLIAERGASSTVQRDETANVVVDETSNRELSLERDDPLLSDHPYGLPSWRRSGVGQRQLHQPLSMNSNDLAGSARSETTDHHSSSAAADFQATSDEIQRQRRELRHYQRRISGRRPFFDYYGTSPDEGTVDGVHPSALHRSTRGVIPQGRSRERRLRELLDRRQELVSQIEHLRSARELLFPGATEVPSSFPNITTPARSIDVPSSFTNATSPGRAIDEWALNRRMALERSSEMDQRGHQEDQSRRMSTRWMDLPLHDSSRNDEFPHRPTTAAARARSRLVRSLLAASTTLEAPARAVSSTQVNPAIMNQADVEAATEPVINDWPPDQQSQQQQEQQQQQQQEQQQQQAQQQQQEQQTQQTQQQEQQQSTALSSSSTPSTESAAEAAAAADRQNLDIVLLTRHIDHMQRICRASLSDLAVTRQRRQVVRLQTIRRMLEDLQRQIRSLRTASLQELNRRTHEAESLGSALGSVTRGEEPRRRGSSAVNRQRATAAFYRLGRSNPSRAASLRGGRNRLPRAPSSRLAATSANNKYRVAANTATTMTPRSNAARARLRRAHTKLVSKLRATFRAMVMSPDLARQRNSLVNESRAEASRAVMERTERQSNGVRTDGRGELRAISQRLERMLRERREAEESGNAGAAATAGEEAEDESNNPEDSSSVMDSLPRLNPTPIYHHRWRHLLFGTPEYNRLGTEMSAGATAASSLSPASRSSLIRRSSASSRLSRRLLASQGDSSGVLPDLDSDSESSDGPFYGFSSPGSPGPSTDAPPPARAPTLHLPPSAAIGYESVQDYLNNSSRTLRGPDSDRGQRAMSLRDRLGQHGPNIDREPRRIRRRTAEQLERHHFPTATGVANRANAAAAGSQGSRLPPLQELIWRRLRRRNAQLSLLDDAIGAEAAGTGGASSARTSATGRRERSRHREMLSWMVDQLTIDQFNDSSSGQDSNAVPVTAHGASTLNSATITSNHRPLNLSVRPPSHLGTFATSPPASRSPSTSPRPTAARPPLPNERPSHRNSRYVSGYQRESTFLQHIDSSSTLRTHRIQAWDFSQFMLPDLSDPMSNVVVREAKIHNDASVDLSVDGTILVTLVPSNLPMTTVVGVFGLAPRPEQLGQCYATYSLESSAVSVSLSPTARHLIVGLTNRAMANSVSAARVSLSPANNAAGAMAQVFRIQLPWESSGAAGTGGATSHGTGHRGRLIHRRDLAQTESGQTALNCIRWIPVAGQGIVYATNTGLLKILR